MQAFSKRQVALGRLLLLAFFLRPALGAASDATTNGQQIATIKAQMDAAILRVQQIVNQPVTELRRTPDMRVETFGPGGWFHPGAIKPMFLIVDVRATQEFPYNGKQYVTSDLKPGVVFLGSELEFNPMTKYFYTDRSVPKRKLTESEMLEINQLYRVIGRCEHQLVDIEHPIPKRSMNESQQSDESRGPQPLLTTVHRWIFTHKLAGVGAVLALLVILFFLRKKQVGDPAD